MAEPYRLITIAPSHYCEKARWGLEKAGVRYREEPHPPLLHIPAVRAAGGSRSTPVLVADGVVAADSTDILVHLQERGGDGWRPYPEVSELGEQASELEELFDTRLGPHTRRLAYFHLLQDRRLFLRSVLAGVGRGERLVFRALGPLPAHLMRRGMRINRESAGRSLARVREVFERVARLLDDGRSFLVGDDFSAADLSFAALAAPVLLPASYGSALPEPHELPDEFLRIVEDMRATAAGAFALGLYEEHR